MRLIIYIYSILLLSIFWSCTPTHKQSVEDESWQSIMKQKSAREINLFFNDFPQSKYLDTLIKYKDQYEFNNDLLPQGPCCRNFLSLRMENKDSVWLEDSLFFIDDLQKEIHNILKGPYSKTDFVDHLGIERHFSNSVFAINLRDSVPLNQDVLVKVKAASNPYKDSLIQAWYPIGYPKELANSKFEKKINLNLLLSWRKPPPIPPKPPKHFYD